MLERFRQRRILIIGGAGFVGKYLWNKWPVPERVVLDLKFGEDVLDGIKGKWDTIIFLAADKDRTIKAKLYNIELYATLDTYMEQYPGTHVVFTSSAAVYGDKDYMVDEKTLVGPINNYGQAKLIGEAYVVQYKRYSILRLSNVLGSGDGEGVYDHFINGGITIYGDGMDVRDYVPAGTVAEVIRQAVEGPAKWHGITNVSSGVGTTVNKLFYQVHGDSIFPDYVAKRPGDVRFSILDNSKMRRLMR